MKGLWRDSSAGSNFGEAQADSATHLSPLARSCPEKTKKLLDFKSTSRWYTSLELLRPRSRLDLDPQERVRIQRKSQAVQESNHLRVRECQRCRSAVCSYEQQHTRAGMLHRGCQDRPHCHATPGCPRRRRLRPYEENEPIQPLN